MCYHLNNMKIISKGNNPKLGLFSGIHGDEWRIIKHVENIMNKYSDSMSAYLYIPQCSPSAVEKKTRENENGVDLNRSFIKSPTIKEAQELVSALQPFTFDLCIDFHEDPEDSPNAGVYLYDSENIEGSEILKSFRDQVKKVAPLFTGIDDSSDTGLGRMANEGYRPSLPPEKDNDGNYIYDGYLDFWALIEGKTKRWLTLEVPTSFTDIQKEQVVDIFFKVFVLENK